MRYGPNDRALWVVVDPRGESVLEDILFQASLRDLRLQFLGGLTMEENPTLFTDPGEAEAEARRRLEALRESERAKARARSRDGSRAGHKAKGGNR